MEKKPVSPETKRGYIISIALILVFIALMLNFKDVASQPSAKELMGALSDSFTVPGVLFCGVGGLTFLATLGAYDSFGYIFSRFSLHNVWVTKKREKYESLYDYKTAKDEKGRKWLPYVFFTGLCSLALGVIFLVIYFIL
ncbi:MAG: DUF3899 domain-containing protein [Clostridiales bacterium]|nr:DUF3899 domain-containing protein [Clostridiales bacterium]